LARLSYFARLLGRVEPQGPVIAPAHPLLDRWRAVSALERFKPVVAAAPGKRSATAQGIPQAAGMVEDPPVLAPIRAPSLRGLERRTNAAALEPDALTRNDPPLAATKAKPIAPQIKSEASPAPPVVREVAKPVAEPGLRPAKTFTALQRKREAAPHVASMTSTLEPSRSPASAQAPRRPDRRVREEVAAELALTPAAEIAPGGKERSFAPPLGAPMSDFGAQNNPPGATPSPLHAPKRRAMDPIPLEPRAPPQQSHIPGIETAAAKTGGVHIGAIDIYIQPPAAPVQPAPRTLPLPSAPLARGFSSPFGIRQG